MDGLATTQDISLADTSYYGEVTSISPETSGGRRGYHHLGPGRGPLHGQPPGPGAAQLDHHPGRF